MTDASSSEVRSVRTTTIHGVLTELLRVELAQRREVETQRHVLREIGTALVQLSRHWHARTREAWCYHSLEELLRLHETLRQRSSDTTATTTHPGSKTSSERHQRDEGSGSHGGDSVVNAAPAAVSSADVEALIEARLLDPYGLPVSHALIFGSLTVWGLSRLLGPIQHWVRWFSEQLPRLVREVVPSAVAELDACAQSTVAMTPSCLSREVPPPAVALKLWCASLAHLLEYCRLSTLPRDRPVNGHACRQHNSPHRVSSTPVQTPLLAQLLVRGPGTSVTMSAWGVPMDLRPLRAGVRFMIVDLEELRDTLRDAAQRMVAADADEWVSQSLPLAALSTTIEDVLCRLRQTVPAL